MKAKKNEAARTDLVTAEEQEIIKAGTDAALGALARLQANRPETAKVFCYARIILSRNPRGQWDAGYQIGTDNQEPCFGMSLGEALADMLSKTGRAGKLARAKRLRAEADQLEKEAEEGRESCKR